jgi:putative ABC transport system ATP-binding protein
MTGTSGVAPRPADGRLHVVGLTVAYGSVVAVDDVSLGVGAGQILGVTGPSGAGKSSLLWALAGALTPAAGTVELNGVRVRAREQAAALGVAVIPQGNALAAALTARENIVVPLLAAGRAARDSEQRALAALSAVGLEESREHLIEELSGGQQQRVAIARALAAGAALILADEPTSDLDGANRERVIAALRREADAGAIVVMSTHDPEAAALTDAEVALDEGHLTWVRGRRG